MENELVDMAKYFSHDINAQHDDKIVRLLYELGWKGYGVFWAVIERLNEQDSCTLAYNVRGLAWSLNVEEEFLQRVLTEFELFTFSDDGKSFWSESAMRRAALRSVPRHVARAISKQDVPQTPKRGRGRPRKHPLPAPVEAEVTEEPENASLDVAEDVSSARTDNLCGEIPHASCGAYNGDGDDGSTVVIPAVPAERLISAWNELFAGTKQIYHGLSLDPISYQRAIESLKIFSIADIEQAFAIARNDSFAWLLENVLKSTNIQRLLAKGDINNGTDTHRTSGRSDSTTTGFDWSDPKYWNADPDSCLSEM